MNIDTRIATFNAPDFSRSAAIEAVHPEQLAEAPGPEIGRNLATWNLSSPLPSLATSH
jgi:hypothetical protein